MLTLAAAFALACQDGNPMQEIDEIRRDIELYRALHSLNLKKDQLEKLVKLAKDSRKSVDDAVAERKDDIDRLKKAMKELRDALEKGDPSAPELEREIGELHRAMGEVMRRFQETVERIAEELKKILDEKQWKTVSSMNRPDPLRPMREQVAHFIDRVREDPNIQMDEEIVNRIREGVERMARPLGLSEKDIEAEVERIRKIVEEIFNSSGEELGKKRDEFVRRIFEEGKLGEAASKMGPPPEEANRRVATTFLNPKVLQFLQKRLENAK
ncbi:MAG: hypothetical protein HYY17_13095 [Planctomycetes bacterium]|nr:hypothetical protein [Planctomycetota bacterium]